MRRFAQRVLGLFRHDRAERELAREVDSHLALIEEEHVRRGVTLDQARAAARRAMGSVALANDLHRDARSFAWIDDDGVSTGYQRGDFGQLDVAVDGGRVTLKRTRGNIAVTRLVWTLPTAVTEVRINGATAAFTQVGSTVTVTLPEFSSTLDLVVR